MKNAFVSSLMVLCGLTASVQAAPEVRFNSPNLPPLQGVYVTPAQFHAAYANGIVISNISHRRFTQATPPPPAGGTQVHNFGSIVEFDRLQPGAPVVHALANAGVQVQVKHVGTQGTMQIYETEMLQLNIAGGALPPGVMVRESPTLASMGRTTVRPAVDGNGFMIDSFFDIFTEMSLNGGQNWSPAQQAAHVELRMDPTAVPPIIVPSSLLPPRNDQYITPALFHLLFANGVIIRDIRHSLFTRSLPPPTGGTAQGHVFDSQVDFQISTDGGANFRHGRAPALTATSVRLRSTEGGTQVYDTEMSRLEISEGELPPGLRLRESPTLPSLGGTAIQKLADGTFQMQSFFDIFTEVSLDGGANWVPAREPARVQLVCDAPEHPFPDPNLPPPSGHYVSPQRYHALYAQGIILSNISHRRFTQSQPPPPPGGAQTHTFDSEIQADLSEDGGQSWKPISAPASVVVRMTSSADADGTRFFDTEMLSLDIRGGNLPAGVMVRESPSKASLGRTSMRQVTDGTGGIWDYISSFFDVFTELSLDGGQRWLPAEAGPGHVVLDILPLFPPVQVSCPPNQLVTTTSPNGAVVLYGSALGFGGCDPVPQVVCVPPSGSTFPVGTTTVTCTASDSCGQTATCTFTVTVRRVRPIFFPTPVLPPPTGVYITPRQYHQLYANGIIIRDIRHRRFTGGQPPPPVGGPSQTHAFGSTVELEHSMDGGATFQKASAQADCTVRVIPRAIVPASIGTQTFDTEMLALNIAGGSLPAGVMIRESPTRASMGKTSLRQVGGGYFVDSFFDIFTEISLDGGANWSPAQAAAPVELRVDPRTVPPVPAPTPILPPRNDAYISPAQFHLLAAQGIVIRDIRHSFFTRSVPPPPPGGTQFHEFGSQIDLELSTDGGQTFRHARVPAPVVVEVSDLGGGMLDTEMLQLELDGGDLPPGLMIRESPTEPSRGGVQIDPMPDGTYLIGSFFDIFTELSFDGGQNWRPTATPGRVELICDAPEQKAPSPNLPPANGEYISPRRWHQLYAQGIIISNVIHRRFTQNQPPPPPGGAQTHQFGSEVEFDLIRPGLPVLHLMAPANVLVGVRSAQEEGDTRYFDTEMLSLNISGGGLPAGMMVRESPTRASLGRTSIRMVNDPATGIWDYISSFFDVFTELSLDGGQTWLPGSDPGHVVLKIPMVMPIEIRCPLDISVIAAGAAGAVVNYPPPIAVGGCGPLTIDCNPPSGSTFPIGSTVVTCVARDDCGNSATCVFKVEVRPPVVEIDHFENSSALVGLRMPDGSLVNVILSGPATVHVDLTSLQDTPANGLEEVTTELVDMKLTGGGVTLVAGSANGLPPSLGEIQERANIQVGRLDLPGPDAPFCTPPLAANCAGTSADSHFNVFFEVTLPGGQRLHNRTPLRVEAVITEKPPRANYRHVITQPIQLFDENNNPTGVFLVTANHNTRPQEIDRFENSSALVGLRMPDGSLVNVILSGPATVAVALDSLQDSPPNGLEEVETELVAMNLSGGGITLVAGSANGLPPSLGEIQERANIQLGRLDLPGPDAPFCTPPLAANCAGTSADSYFNVFFEVTLPGGQRLHNRTALRVEAVITEKPPRANYRHVITQPIQLFDENGNPTGVFLVTANHDTRPKEIDRFENSSALVGLRMPDGSLVNVILNGPATVAVALDSLQDAPANGREEVSTELVSMNLSGGGVTLVAGSANGLPPSLGEIEERVNVVANRLDLPGPDAPFCTPPLAANCAGTSADSYFNVFFEVTLPGGQRLHNRTALRVEAVITEKPPRANYRHVITQPIQLFDENGNPTGVFLVTANHDTRPKEIDRFENSSALVGLRMPDGSLVNVILNGPATVAVALDSLQDAPANGREEVSTELVSMNLSGGGVTLVAGSANGLPPSLGEIEERVNVVANRLDLPGPDAPFCTPPLAANCAGTSADSYFNVFFEVTLPGGQRLHNRTALRVEAVITEKPPRANYRHVITQPIQLFDENGNPTGVFLVTANHDTRPKEIDRFENSSALVGLRMPDGSLVNVILNGPATVAVALDSLQDAPANGREEVSTELVSMNLSGGGVTLVAGSANGLPPSLGEIEERVNVEANRLDLPGPDAPFCTPPLAANCAGTSADSYFNVFFEVTLPGGQRLHNRTALRVEAVITEKPPRANYRHVITNPIELLDENDRPTGVFLVTANHDTRPKEIDRFENSSALVGLRMPDGSLVNVILNGPATVAVALDSLQDAPANGREEVSTELVSMNLSGGGVTLVAGSANGLPPSLGEIEERVNVVANRLDLPGPDAPFCTPPLAANCAGTSADSYFNVFFEVTLPGGQRLHNRTALRVEAVITEKPPRANYRHVITNPIELLDENDRPTGVFLVTANHDTRPKEIDRFPSSGAAVGLRLPNGNLVNLIMTGPSTVAVALDSLQDSPPNGLEEVNTELVAMNLTDVYGQGYQLIAGSVNGLPPSVGEIEETQNRLAGRLDLHGPDAPFCLPGALNCDGTTALSTFEVMFAVILPNGQRLHNRAPLHMEAIITEKPPHTLYRHVIPAPIELYDENNNQTGIFIVTAEHNTRPREIDPFPNTLAIIELCRDNSSETVPLTGPTTVAVDIGPNGETTLTDGAGHDRVLTHMLDMNLSGLSSLGPVTVQLNPNVDSDGDIIEQVNSTPGILDIRPFRPAGLANSCFDMYVRITVQTPAGPLVLHNRDPKRMCAVIDFKPPGPGTVYENPNRVPLYLDSGAPSGFFMCAARHIPVPSTNCAVRIDCPSNIVVWGCSPNGQTVNYPPPTATSSCNLRLDITCVPPSGANFPPGNNAVVCTARDPLGNTASCTFTVRMIHDTTPPVIFCPSNNLVAWTCSNSIVVPYVVAAVDDCDPSVTVVCTPPGNVFPAGNTTVNCVARDNCGNTSTCTFTVRVTRDTTPPVLAACPSNIVIQTCRERERVVYVNPTATDDCDATPTVVCNPPSGTVFPIGSHVVICRATDDCGNESKCEFRVEVRSSDVPPRLTITKLDNNRVMICWDATCPGWVLQCTRDLNSPIQWVPVTVPPTITGTRHCVILPNTGRHQFYRLCKLEPDEVYAATDLLPTPGVYEAGDEITVILFPAPGAPPRPILARWFRHPVPPPDIFPPRPPPCLTCPPDIFRFQTELQFQFSPDDGMTWMDVSGMSDVAVRVGFDPQPDPPAPDVRSFDTEMLQLDMRGEGGGGGGADAGILPPPFMLRESPTLPSKGKTTVRQSASGDGTYMIGSFFDVFIEVSLDGGQTWGAVLKPIRMTLKSKPVEQYAETDAFPPTGSYTTPRAQVTRYSNGILTRWYLHPIPPDPIPIPIPGPNPPCLSCPRVDFDFTIPMHFQVSINGGQDWMDVSAMSDVSVHLRQSRALGDTRFFEMEMDGLRVQPQPEPPIGAASAIGGVGGVRLRESPSRPSKGTTTVRKMPDGTFMISSFFDIFTELSLDGGQTWDRSIEASHVEYGARPRPQHAETAALPPAGVYASPAAQVTEFDNGLRARWYRHPIPIPIPPIIPRFPPCLTCPREPFEFITELQFQVSNDGGRSWADVSAMSKVGGIIGPATGVGGLRGYDTEMTLLDAEGMLGQGGAAGPGAHFMLRESPTRSSKGHTEIQQHADGTYRIGSFFDIFTEVSLDGGATWAKSKEPTHVSHVVSPPEQYEAAATFPPPGSYNSPASEITEFEYVTAAGQHIPSLKTRWYLHQVPPFPPGGCPFCPPPPCLQCPPVDYGFQADIRFQVSSDGGVSWMDVVAKTDQRVRVKQTMALGGMGVFETEMLSLSLVGSGPGLPQGVMIRESPSKQSLGITTMRQVPGMTAAEPSGHRVSGFFDIFTDISLDGGQTWASVRKPSHVILNAQPPPVGQAMPTFPPLGSYNSPRVEITRFPNGILARRYRHIIRIPPIIPRPWPCLQCPPEIFEFPAPLLFEFSVNGGQTWQEGQAQSLVQVMVDQTMMPGGAMLFDTEMLRLDAQIPIPGTPGVRLRESPTRRSIGTTLAQMLADPRPDPFGLSSFFDIFTELSLDGGANWSPSMEPTHVELQPQ